ncbi:Transcriptional activator protein ExaE [Dissostichus eleginoides]|uniref:Transcriptional activator protein ExaE n=1 Tax=Dissostichus eleginoides TaxID=100907 RepID=A0AAD9ESN3_DISEL|nr:Transcriptional activator protein ExaE [Dissostichus eleginoides]
MSLKARPGFPCEITSRVHEQSETCSAAFFSSVRAKKARQVVTGIRDSQGIVVTEDGQMVRVATDHFRDSFKEKEVGRGDDFLELLERQVPGDIVQALELPLTLGKGVAWDVEDPSQGHREGLDWDNYVAVCSRGRPPQLLWFLFKAYKSFAFY